MRRFNNIITIIIVLLKSMALVFKSDSTVAYVFCAVLELGTEMLLHEVKYPGYKPYKQIDWVLSCC